MWGLTSAARWRRESRRTTREIRPPSRSLTGGCTWVCGVARIVSAVVDVSGTEYYPEARDRPVRDIAKSPGTGPGTNIVAGFAVGLQATAIPAGVVSIAILFSFWL